ncbi:MAG: hypothetical protein KH037_10530 [Burkholderiales bacterium]|uniref:lysozyme inhibitor LprI family protein n=1 Tax=Turicimonas muris TaxID=1796652 RepID=UPI001EC0449F|nr:hypothetical protein [Turicimonas muris]MBS4847099.1 hypothetical protein [Burkholderiales bacterium]
MFKLRIYLLVFTLLVGSICNAASFDCKKARSYSEKLICSNFTLSAADDALAKIYEEAKKTTKNSKEFRALIKKNWHEREKCKTEQCVFDWYQRVSQQYQKIADGSNKELQEPNKDELQEPSNELSEDRAQKVSDCWENTINKLDDSKIDPNQLANIVIDVCKKETIDYIRQSEPLRNKSEQFISRVFEETKHNLKNQVVAAILFIRKWNKEHNVNN